MGARISAWQALTLESIFWRVEMEKVAVLPVPDWACAMTSLPVVCQFCFFRCVGGVVGVVCVWANSPLMTGMMARC